MPDVVLPRYEVHANGHNLTPMLEALTWQESVAEVAGRCTFTFGLDPYASVPRELLVNAGDSVRVYADGVLVFTGRVWERDFTDEASQVQMQVTAYDDLRYLVQSTDDFFFPDGIDAPGMIAQIAARWSLPLYQNDLPAVEIQQRFWRRAKVAQVIIDVMELVRLEVDAAYVLRSPSIGGIQILRYGANLVNYAFGPDYLTQVGDHEDINDLVTRVVLIGVDRFDEGDESAPIEVSERTVLAPLPGHAEGTQAMVDRYGLLQEVLYATDYGGDIEQVQRAAELLLNTRGKPHRYQKFSGPDIPFMRKGDMQTFRAGTLDGKYPITALMHDAVAGLMHGEIDTSGVFSRRVRLPPITGAPFDPTADDPIFLPGGTSSELPSEAGAGAP